MTGLDLISRSLRMLNALASGEAPESATVNEALTCLNSMLDSWNAENLFIFTVTRNVFTLTPSVQSYTLGSGGAFNLARPAKIQGASILDVTTNATQPLEVPITLLSESEWQRIILKSLDGLWPTGVWDDNGFPLRTLNFWPIPTTQLSTVLYLWAPLTSFSDLSTDVTYPPGYQDAIAYNLAVRLSAEGFGQASQLVVEMAQRTMGVVKSMNLQDVTFRCDDRALRGNMRNSSIYAIYQG